ncbi:MAG: zinc-dependent metalloprotease [Actinomycetota bacterium]
MTFAAQRLVDWDTATLVGERVAGNGALLSPVERARLMEDFGELVPLAEGLVEEFTGLTSGENRARAWVMTRRQWLEANLRGFERLIEPFAEKILARQGDGPLAKARRTVLGAQVGGLLGYLGHRVLGQYDVLLPPDDDGLVYFVGPNVAGLERKFDFPAREFRLWLSLHETAHRVQFGRSPWLRGYVSGLMNDYLATLDLQPGWLSQSLRRALDELRSGRVEHRAFGWVFLLMTPDQRDMVRRMQAVMSLVEGHGNYVMDGVAIRRIPQAAAFRRKLRERRNRSALQRVFHKAIGLDVKVRQYDLGERFVAGAVRAVGMDSFNRIWENATTLPTIEEIRRPDRWVARVVTR